MFTNIANVWNPGVGFAIDKADWQLRPQCVTIIMPRLLCLFFKLLSVRMPFCGRDEHFDSPFEAEANRHELKKTVAT
jgi:hypothetical protein